MTCCADDIVLVTFWSVECWWSTCSTSTHQRVKINAHPLSTSKSLTRSSTPQPWTHQHLNTVCHQAHQHRRITVDVLRCGRLGLVLVCLCDALMNCVDSWCPWCLMYMSWWLCWWWLCWYIGDCDHPSTSIHINTATHQASTHQHPNTSTLSRNQTKIERVDGQICSRSIVIMSTTCTEMFFIREYVWFAIATRQKSVKKKEKMQKNVPPFSDIIVFFPLSPPVPHPQSTNSYCLNFPKTRRYP